MRILALAARNLRRRSWHSRVAAAVLTLATLALILSLGYVQGIRHLIGYVDRHELWRLGAIVVHSPGEMPDWEQISSATASLLPVLRAQPGVAGVGLVQRHGWYLHRPGTPAQWEGLRAPFESLLINRDLAAGFPLPLAGGRWFTAADLAPDQADTPVVVSSRWARDYPLGHRFTGWFLTPDTLELAPQRLRVVGIFRAGSLYLSGGFGGDLYQDLRPAPGMIRPWLGPEAAMADATAWVIAESEAALAAGKERWSAALRAALPAAGPDRPELEVQMVTLREAEATYRRIVRQPLAHSLWLTGIVVALAAFGYGSLNAVSVWDRRQEWGIHLACGATRRDLALMLLAENLAPFLAPLLVVGALLAVALPAGVVGGVRVDGWVALQAGAILLAVAGATGLGPVLAIRMQAAAALVRGLEQEG